MAVALLGLSILFFLGHLLRGIFRLTKIPDLLIITLIGYTVGPGLGLVRSDDFGQIGSILSTIALIVILYEGGIHLKAKDLVTSSWPTLKITLAGFSLIIIAITIVGIVLGFKAPTTAFLLGLVLSSTASAVVIPLVRVLSVSDKVKTVLGLESAVTDILTIVLFLVAVEGISAGAVDLKSVFISIGPKTLLAIAAGSFFAIIWAILKSLLGSVMPKAFAGEAFAILVYGLVELMGLNGALGVLAYGFTIGNITLLPIKNVELLAKEMMGDQEVALLSEISNVLRTFFFLYLGILIQFSSVTVVLVAIAITCMIYLTRYISVRFLFGAKDITRMEAMTMTAMGPRGLAAAVLATLPLQKGIEDGRWIQDTAFSVILISIVATAGFVLLIEQKYTRQMFAKFFLKFPESSPVVSKD
jgi:NhaP-type Na+/H+ or K+/H+ antiporter